MSEKKAVKTFDGVYHVYSTLSNDQAYTRWGKPEKGGLPEVDATVRIHGKANVPNDHFVTPKGVVTTVNAQQMRELADCPMFVRHENAGYIVVEKAKVDPDKVAKDMTAKDASAPKTDDDFKKPPKTGKVKD